MDITKKVVILTIIGMLALGVMALAGTISSNGTNGPVTTGATCSTSGLQVTSNVVVVQGFVATATAYDATFCGVTGLALAGTEAPGKGGSVGSGFTGTLSNVLEKFGALGTAYANGAEVTDFNQLGNDDLVLAGLLVKSNYNKVNVIIQVKGFNIANGSISKLNIAISTIDDHGWWSNPEHIGSVLTTSTNGDSGVFTLTESLGAGSGSPYQGFLFLYTVYNGTKYFYNSGSNQIAPWVQAGKYPVTFTFTITPSLSL